MMNGCICCAVRQDLSPSLDKLVRAGASRHFKATTATSSRRRAWPIPRPWPNILCGTSGRRLRALDGIITLSRRKHIIQHLDEEKPEGVCFEAMSRKTWRRRTASRDKRI